MQHELSRDRDETTAPLRRGESPLVCTFPFVSRRLGDLDSFVLRFYLISTQRENNGFRSGLFPCRDSFGQARAGVCIASPKGGPAVL